MKDRTLAKETLDICMASNIDTTPPEETYLAQGDQNTILTAEIPFFS